jgi:glycosyltransferase involved in cell wall biosynthesis
MRVFVHSRAGLGLTAHKDRFARDLEHDPTPYGFDALGEPGVSVAFSEDGPYRRLSAKLIQRFGMDPVHALYNLSAMRKADVIWTVLEWEWLSVSLLQRLGLLRNVPVIGNSVWLFDHWPSWSRRRRMVLKWLMGPNVLLTLHSRTALDRSRSFVPDRVFQLSPFGVSARAFPLTAPARLDRNGRPIRVYAIGNDGTRDWQTMLDAFGNDPQFEVVIVCAWLGQQFDIARYTNLTWPADVPVSKQRAFYQWADVVVIPMRDNAYSGITVACEAAAMGKPVVCSHAGGVPTYFDPGEIVYVPPSDPGALRDAVLALTPNRMHSLAASAQQRFCQSGYSAPDMVRRYLKLSRSLPELSPGAGDVVHTHAAR